MKGMKDEPIASTEYLAIRDALLQFRYCDGRPVDPHERNLVNELLQLGETYGANGHYIARELEKLLHQVQVMPLTAPERPAWFVATMESRLKRRTHATASNLATAPDPEARRVLGGLMEHSTLEIAPEERRAREFERLAGGNRWQAMQDCMSQIAGSDPVEGGVLIGVALWMVREGWSLEFPRKAPVVEFGGREGKKTA